MRFGPTAHAAGRGARLITIVALLVAMVSSLSSWAASAASGPVPASEVGGITVSVGYGDTARPNPQMPVPWRGDPDTEFFGTPTGLYDTGAILLDNTTDHAVLVDNVDVVLPRDNGASKYFSLWGRFTIQAGQMAILAQTEGHRGPQYYETNFDTSDYPLFQIPNCQSVTPAGPTDHPPEVTVRITSGGATTQRAFLDTGHILDTGGFDSAKCGNESLGWRMIGTTGVRSASESVALSASRHNLLVGATVALTATVTDASGHPLANVPVTFKVVSGPNAGRQWTASTDTSGQASVGYASSSTGLDKLQALIPNASRGLLGSPPTWVLWRTPAVTLTPASGRPGSTVAVAGTGFAAGEGITVKLNCSSATCGGTRVQTLGSTISNTNGSFSLDVVIPISTALGGHVVGAVGADGDFGANGFVVTLR